MDSSPTQRRKVLNSDSPFFNDVLLISLPSKHAQSKISDFNEIKFFQSNNLQVKAPNYIDTLSPGWHREKLVKSHDFVSKRHLSFVNFSILASHSVLHNFLAVVWNLVWFAVYTKHMLLYSWHVFNYDAQVLK